MSQIRGGSWRGTVTKVASLKNYPDLLDLLDPLADNLAAVGGVQNR
jgi:hypothetical protein